MAAGGVGEPAAAPPGGSARARPASARRPAARIEESLRPRQPRNAASCSAPPGRRREARLEPDAGIVGSGPLVCAPPRGRRPASRRTDRGQTRRRFHFWRSLSMGPCDRFPSADRRRRPRRRRRFSAPGRRPAGEQLLHHGDRAAVVLDHAFEEKPIEAVPLRRRGAPSPRGEHPGHHRRVHPDGARMCIAADLLAARLQPALHHPDLVLSATPGCAGRASACRRCRCASAAAGHVDRLGVVADHALHELDVGGGVLRPATDRAPAPRRSRGWARRARRAGRSAGRRRRGRPNGTRRWRRHTRGRRQSNFALAIGYTSMAAQNRWTSRRWHRARSAH